VVNEYGKKQCQQTKNNGTGEILFRQQGSSKILCKKPSNQTKPARQAWLSIPLVLAVLPEVSLVMRAEGVNDAAGFREP